MDHAEAAQIIAAAATTHADAIVTALGLEPSQAAQDAVAEYLRSDEFAKIARSFMTSPADGSAPTVNARKLADDVTMIIGDALQMERKGRASYAAGLKLMALAQ
jgi:isocitrate/isopropylmalate dehydrogenase